MNAEQVARSNDIYGGRPCVGSMPQLPAHVSLARHGA